MANDNVLEEQQKRNEELDFEYWEHISEVERIKEDNRRKLETDVYGCSPWDQNPLE